jgi:hypothetical protein
MSKTVLIECISWLIKVTNIAVVSVLLYVYDFVHVVGCN